MNKTPSEPHVVHPDVSSYSLDDLRRLMQLIIKTNPHSGRFMDILTALRGPDSPSERSDMTSAESSNAYRGRRARKFKTVEVIRDTAFFGTVGGAMRHHSGTKVIVAPPNKQDHFDRHVIRAASALGLDVEVEKE